MRYVRERTKEKGFHKCLMVMDAFKTHFTGYVAAAMLIGLTGVAKVTAGLVDFFFYFLFFFFWGGGGVGEGRDQTDDDDDDDDDDGMFKDLFEN